MYGIKQSPKQWHEKFDNLIILDGYKVNENDKCIYYKSKNNICNIICLYVYKLLILGSNILIVNVVKSLSCNNFDMKHLREVSVILEIKITRSEMIISLDQYYYVGMILRKYNYIECKRACTPYNPSVKLFKSIGDSVRQTEYASIIVSLRYVTDCTRPKIAYVMGLLCRFTSILNNEHWKTIKIVMWYLKININLNLHYQRFSVVLEGYNAAYWNALLDDFKPTSGYISYNLRICILEIKEIDHLGSVYDGLWNDSINNF